MEDRRLANRLAICGAAAVVVGLAGLFVQGSLRMVRSLFPVGVVLAGAAATAGRLPDRGRGRFSAALVTSLVLWLAGVLALSTLAQIGGVGSLPTGPYELLRPGPLYRSGSSALVLALCLPLGVAWRTRQRWLVAALVAVATVPLVGLASTAHLASVREPLVYAFGSRASPLLDAALVTVPVLLAAAPLYHLGRTLSPSDADRVAVPAPALLAFAVVCGTQAFDVAVALSLVHSPSLITVLIPLWPVPVLAAYVGMLHSRGPEIGRHAA